MADITNVKAWLTKLLKERFNINAELMTQLSAVDLFYLYAEIYTFFKVKLKPDDIDRDCFASLDLLSEHIHKNIRTGIYEI
jgi:hypothetical protein